MIFLLLLVVVVLCIVYDFRNSQYVSKSVNTAYAVSIILLAVTGFGIIGLAVMLVSVGHVYLAKQKFLAAQKELQDKNGERQ